MEPSGLFSQYRTLTNTFLIERKPDKIKLKIFDISQKCISKIKFNADERLAEQKPSVLIETLVEQGQLSSKEVVLQNSPPSIEECIKELEHIITLNDAQDKNPIPTLSNFQRENQTLASSSLKMAQEFIEANEFNEAIKAFENAFQYSQKWEDYEKLPHFFEKYKKTNEAGLSYLYLAQYQFQGGQNEKAIGTLEHIQKNYPKITQISLLLNKLYWSTKQSEKMIDHGLKMGEILAHNYPEQAMLIYRHLLAVAPNQWNAYSSLANILQDPREKAHILLVGACHAIEANELTKARKFCEQAENYHNESFIDLLIDIDLRLKEKSDVKEKILSMAKLYERKNLIPQMIQSYRVLLKDDKSFIDNIIQGYLKSNKPQKARTWSLYWLSMLINNNQWEKAEKILLTELRNSDEKIPYFEQLEKIYTNWNRPQLNDLWRQLGKAYLQKEQLSLAEAVYKKAYDQFNSFEFGLALADTYSKQNKNDLGVQTYYQISSLALLEKRFDQLIHCVNKIKQIDPQLQHLEVSQRVQLLTQQHLIEMGNRIDFLQNELNNTNEKFEKQIFLLHSKRRKNIMSDDVLNFNENKKISITNKTDELDLSNYSSEVTNFILKRIGQICEILRKLNLTGCERITDSSIKELTENCENIRILSLNGCTKLTAESIIYIAKNCPNIETLNLSGCAYVTDEALIEVSKRAEYLKELVLDGCTQITDTSITEIAKNCPDLRHLSLRGCMRVTGNFLPELGKNSPFFATLNLEDCYLTGEGFEALAKNCPKLKKLELEGCVFIEPPYSGLVNNQKYLTLEKDVQKQLEQNVLSMKDCGNLTDRTMACLTKKYPNLIKIYLTNCRALTDKSLNEIAQNCKNLQVLNVTGFIVTPKALDEFRNMLPNCQNSIDYTLMSALSKIHDNDLNLSNCNLDETTLTAIAIKYPNLKHISFTGGGKLANPLSIIYQLCRIMKNLKVISMDKENCFSVRGNNEWSTQSNSYTSYIFYKSCGISGANISF